MLVPQSSPKLGHADELRHRSRWIQDPSGALSVEPVYYGELFTNARGGKSTEKATLYQGLLDIGIRLDLEKSGLELPGDLYVLAQNTHGRGLTQDFIGDTQVISNIDSFDNIMQVGEYWWETRWIDDEILIRLGKQDFNSEFQHIEAAANFIHSTFGLSPSTAFPTYPYQAMGAVTLLQLSDLLQLKVGGWNAFTRGGSWGFSESDSFLVAGELERRYSIADDGLLGIFAVGAVYESAGVLDGQTVSPVREYFIQWEQTVFRERSWDGEDNQGMALFAGYYPRFPGERPLAESIGDSLVGGLTYTGLLHDRNEDVIGLGVAWSELFQGGSNQETAIEIFYRAAWTTRASIQPDIQYICSPSGIFEDALAAGIRLELTPR
jgi:carbohydrate-selective porin OprB